MSIPNSYFLYIDILIVLIYLIFLFIGYKKGFLFELVSLVYTALTTFISWLLAPVLAVSYPIILFSEMNAETELISKLVNLDAVSNTVIYFVILFLIFKLLYLFVAFILKGMNKLPVIGKFNKVLGCLFGIINATIVTIMLSMLLQLPIIENSNEVINNTIFRFINEYSNNAIHFIVENVDLSSVKSKIDNFDVESARDDFKTWLDHKK